MQRDYGSKEHELDDCGMRSKNKNISYYEVSGKMKQESLEIPGVGKAAPWEYILTPQFQALTSVPRVCDKGQ